MDLARLLVASGASVNPPNQSLLIVSSRTSYDMIKLLVYHGANIEATDENGNTALHLSVPLLGQIGFSDRIVGAVTVAPNAKPQSPPTLVGGEQVARFLLERGANVNARNNAGATPLYAAVSFGIEVPISNMRIANGDKQFFRTLVLPLVKVLLGHGADPNMIAHDGRNPLHVASQIGFTKAVELLLAHGANVNGQDKDGRTPLDIALLYGQDAVAHVLRTHGGKV